MNHNQTASSETAALMRFWSNLGHWIEGGLLAAVGILVLLEALDILSGAWIYLWPALLVVAGLALPLGILGHGHENGWSSRAALLNDPQQRQHLVIGGLLFLAGVAEIVALVAELTILRIVWPAVLVGIGVLFSIHTQHGTSEAAAKAVRVHRVLGGTLLLAGIFRGIAVLSGIYTGIIGLVWIVFLLAAAAQLLFYREPEGAYEDGGHSGH